MSGIGSYINTQADIVKNQIIDLLPEIIPFIAD